MNEPKVSIITPCYRQAQFLPAAIECACAQTYPNIEMVIVNDGSDDDTDQVVQRSGSRIVYVKQSNAGLPAARNSGIAAASGQYFLFLDADDLLHPQAVAWHMQAIADRQDRLSVMGYRAFQSDPEHGEETLLPAGAPALPRMFDFNLAPPIAYLCSRTMIDAVGAFDLDRKLWGCEDWHLWLRIALRGYELVTVERVGAFYRRYAGQMSSNIERMERSKIHVLGRIIKFMQSDPDLRRRWASELQTMQQNRAKMTFDLGYQIAKRGNATQGISLYAQAMKSGHHPVACMTGMIKAVGHAAASRRASPAPIHQASPVES